MEDYILSYEDTCIYESHSKSGEDFRINLWNSLQDKSNKQNKAIIIRSFKFDEFETIEPEPLLN
jgi:hypothetical protein